MRARLIALWQHFNHLAETRRGRNMSLAAIGLMALILSYQGWRDWPKPKPATLLEAYAEAEWRGSYVAITLHYRINKVRDDCSYDSDRLIERVDEKGVIRRFAIEGARGSQVEIGDTSWQDSAFFVPGDLMTPGGDYTLRVRGVYHCPGANWIADPLATPFKVPERPRSEADRSPNRSQPPPPRR